MPLGIKYGFCILQVHFILTETKIVDSTCIQNSLAIFCKTSHKQFKIEFMVMNSNICIHKRSLMESMSLCVFVCLCVRGVIPEKVLI